MHKNYIIKSGIEIFQSLNSRTSVTADNVQRAIKDCGLNKYVKAVLLFLVARLLRKKSAYSVILTYLALGAAYVFSRPCLWEWLVREIIGDENCIGATIISFIQWWDGGVDYVVFGTLTFVTIIVAVFNGIVEIHKVIVHKELKEIHKAITFNPEPNWFDVKCKNAIVKLGERYSDKNNFKNPRLANVYKALTQPEYWSRDFRNSLKEFAIKVHKSYNGLNKQYQGENKDIKDNIDSVVSIFNSKDEEHFSYIFDLIDQIMMSFKNLLYQGDRVFSRYDYDRLADLNKPLEDFRPLCQYISKSVLYIKGLAGTGKSHLIADIVTERMKYGLKSLLLLGLDFQDSTNPKDRILGLLSVKGTWDDFLQKLNRIGELEGHRIVIFIDGVNEGVGCRLWEHQLAEIEADILRHDHLGLVVSARTFMNANMLDAVSKNKATVTMTGFSGMEDEAITYLTGQFGVTLPNVSHLVDFSNPLFLKLYCKSYADETLPTPTSFLDVADNYLRKANEQLAVKYGYEASMYNYVHDATYLLADMYVREDGKKRKCKPLTSFLVELRSILPANIEASSFVQDLTSEGILMCYDGINGNMLVDFNFEIVGDYICAYALLKAGYSQYFGTVRSEGVYEATAVLLPLVLGTEIFDCTSTNIPLDYREKLFLCTLDKRFNLSKSVLDKLEWLRLNDIETFYEYIPKIVMFEECDKLIERFNANLKSMTMIDRDTSYGFHHTLRIPDIDEASVMTLSKWAVSISRNSASRLSAKQTYQASSLLCWTFSIPYFKLRNYATKAVINLLRDKPDVVIKLMELFDDVDDPYIQQRLYAVVHGCVFRGNCGKSSSLAKQIYEKVFNKGVVRPDILLRDYARCAIERIMQDVRVEGIDKKVITPPYGSEFQMTLCPDRQTIESKYRLEYDKGIAPKIVSAQNAILNSMETEYSNGTGGYGDFGRYTFESAIDCWKQDAPLLRNYAVQLIFEKYGYDANRYVKHDSIYQRGRGDDKKMERYGKKLQWIAMYEVMGLLSDNYTMESGVSNDKDVWYQGTWDPHVRDIDTTNAYCRYGSEENDCRGEKIEWVVDGKMPFRINNSETWLRSKEGKSKDTIRQTIEVKDEKGDVWTVLHGYNTLTAEDYSLSMNEDNGLWVFVQAYVCEKNDKKALYKAIYKKGTQGRNAPEYNNSFYSLFYKDYYSSVSYRDYAERTQLEEWNEYGGKNTCYQISYYPYSTEGEISIYRLNRLLFEILGLRDGEKDGEYVDVNGKLIAFDPSVNHQNTGQLLVRKEELVKALKANNLSLVWSVLCEKQRGVGMVGNQIGGVAYYNSRFNLKVKLQQYIERPYAPKKMACIERAKYQARMFWFTITLQKAKKAKAKLHALLYGRYIDKGFSAFDD